MSTVSGIQSNTFAPTGGTKDPIKEQKRRIEKYRYEEKQKQELANLEAKHEAGEISDFEYKITKYFLSQPYTEKEPIIVCYSTTA